jgi:hypothetical protein
MTDPTGPADEPAVPDADGVQSPEPEEFETSEDVRAEAVLLERALGGWRGMIDSGAPTGVFVVAYIATGRDLRSSIIAALVAGGLIVIWRLIRREPLSQIAAGFVGLAISAWWASRNDNASDIYIPGMLTNLGYGTAFLISILVRWPLLGIVMGFLTGEGVAWRKDPVLRRTYAAASWIWVGLFFSRLIVQTPMYLAGWVELQGVFKIAMGYPLFLGAAYWTYRVLQPVFVQKRAEREQALNKSSADPPADDQV